MSIEHYNNEKKKLLSLTMNEHRKKNIFVSSVEQENLFSHWQLKRRITTTTRYERFNKISSVWITYNIDSTKNEIENTLGAMAHNHCKEPNIGLLCLNWELIGVMFFEWNREKKKWKHGKKSFFLSYEKTKLQVWIEQAAQESIFQSILCFHFAFL